MKKILSFVICAVFLVCIFCPVQAEAAIIDDEYNFGKSTEMSAEQYLSGASMKIGAEFDIGGGIEWPIKISMIYPESISPGKAVNISVDTTGLFGEIWYKFYGHAECTVFSYTLTEKTIDYPRTAIFSMMVPIGNEKTQSAHSGQITVATWEESFDALFTDINIKANLRLAFDFEVTTSSYITGTVKCTGDALKKSVSDSHIWDGTAYHKTIDIKNTAKTNDNLDISVSNLKYVMQSMNVKITKVRVYAGYFTNIPLVGNNENAIQGEIPISNLIPNIGTKSDTRENGELFDFSEERDFSLDLDATLTIPAGYESTGLDFGIVIIIGIIAIAVVSIAVVIKFRKIS